MRQIEDLRSALRTLEDATPDAGTVLSAVRAQHDRARPAVRGRQLRARSGMRLTAAIAAAAAVAAVAITVTLLGHGTSPRSHHRGAASADRSRQRLAIPTAFEGLPGYFMESGAEPTVNVVSTATGKVIARAVLPGAIDYLTASQNGAGFAGVETGADTTFYEIRLTGGSPATTVTRLPIPPVTAPIDVIASSPDGSELAIATYVPYTFPGGGSGSAPQNLIVASTATGHERSWSPPDPAADGSMGAISWLADGRTLAFGWLGYPKSSVRLLDTTAPGSDLLSGRAVTPKVTAAGELSEWMAPGGTTVIASTDYPKQIGTLGGRQLTWGSLLQISVRTGRAGLLYYAPPGGGCTDPLWISNSGSRLLMACRSSAGTYVGLVSQGHVTGLPWLNWVLSEQLAFG
jgi:hypothetical protein